MTVHAIPFSKAWTVYTLPKKVCAQMFCASSMTENAVEELDNRATIRLTNLFQCYL